jgi:hypothetical protein
MGVDNVNTHPLRIKYCTLIEPIATIDNSFGAIGQKNLA